MTAHDAVCHGLRRVVMYQDHVGMAFANNFIYMHVMLCLCENRVSFGSNKGGSMVETLIYENTPTEEDPSGGGRCSLASATTTTTTAAAAEISAATSAAATANFGWNKNSNKSKAQHLRSVTGHHHHHSLAEEETQPLLR